MTGNIYKRVNHFRFGRVTVRDMPRPGRPKYATDEFSVEAVRAMVMKDRRFTVKFIGETLKMCPKSVHNIITKDLMMKKVAAKWVPKLLSDEQKEERVRLARQSLRLYEANEDEFLSRFVTMDETWVHHFYPETKRLSMEWKNPGSPTRKRTKRSISAGKGHGISFLGRRRHIND